MEPWGSFWLVLFGEGVLNPICVHATLSGLLSPGLKSPVAPGLKDESTDGVLRAQGGHLEDILCLMHQASLAHGQLEGSIAIPSLLHSNGAALGKGLGSPHPSASCANCVPIHSRHHSMSPGMKQSSRLCGVYRVAVLGSWG